MTVYVDDARIRWRGKDWFHLVADEAEELHLAAGALGLRREWAQDRGRTLHYDLTDHLRERAIALGLAEPIGWRELARWRAGPAPEGALVPGISDEAWSGEEDEGQARAAPQQSGHRGRCR